MKFASRKGKNVVSYIALGCVCVSVALKSSWLDESEMKWVKRVIRRNAIRNCDEIAKKWVIENIGIKVTSNDAMRERWVQKRKFVSEDDWDKK